MSKKIWFVHHYAGSPLLGMSYRAYYFVREFNRTGHVAHVIGASHHHLLMHEKTSQDENVTFQLIEDAPFVLIKTSKHALGNKVKRLLNMFTFMYRLRREYKKIIQQTGKPDIIICSSPHLMTYLATQYIAKNCNAKHILDVQDIWPDSITQLLAVSKWHPLAVLLRRIEKISYVQSDAIVTVLENFSTYLSQFKITHQKHYYIPNGIDEHINASVLLPEKIVSKIALLKKNGAFIIAYTGSHGIPNALDQFIDAAKIVNNDNKANIHFILVGNGSEKKRLEHKAALLNNMSFFGTISKGAVYRLLNQVDACYIGWQNKSIYQYGVSANKIFDYMLAGKPIIHAVNTNFDPVKEAGCGIIVPPNQPELLANSFEYIATLDKSILEAMGKKAKNFVMANHTYKKLAEQYMCLF